MRCLQIVLSSRANDGPGINLYNPHVIFLESSVGSKSL